jgi:hypothetical protein
VNLDLPDRGRWEITVTTETEALVRHAYHLAQGDVLDVQGFIDLFAEDGVFNGIGGVTGQESYRGQQLGDVVVWMGKLLRVQRARANGLEGGGPDGLIRVCS